MKINDLAVEIIRKDIKHLYIKIYPPEGEFLIVSPQRLDDAVIRNFVISQKNWIDKKQYKYQQ